MSAPIILSSVMASWPLFWATFAIGAFAVIALTIIIALVTKDTHSTSRRRRPATPPSPAREAPVQEKVLV